MRPLEKEPWAGNGQVRLYNKHLCLGNEYPTRDDPRTGNGYVGVVEGTPRRLLRDVEFHLKTGFAITSGFLAVLGAKRQEKGVGKRRPCCYGQGHREAEGTRCLGPGEPGKKARPLSLSLSGTGRALGGLLLKARRGS